MVNNGNRTLEISTSCEIHIKEGQLGIHHDSQLNAFNLADDLIEPYRAMVDIVAHDNIGSNVLLSKTERREIAHVLQNEINSNIKSYR